MLYVSHQLEIWWIFQVGVLFWRLQFPFHARYWEQRGAFKYIHIVMLFLGVLVPCVPAIIALVVSGFTAVDYLPFLCAPKGRDASFYTLLLPGSIVLATGVTLLWILTWKIIKVCALHEDVHIYLYFCKLLSFAHHRNVLRKEVAMISNMIIPLKRNFPLCCATMLFLQSRSLLPSAHF